MVTQQDNSKEFRKLIKASGLTQEGASKHLKIPLRTIISHLTEAGKDGHRNLPAHKLMLVRIVLGRLIKKRSRIKE